MFGNSVQIIKIVAIVFFYLLFQLYKQEKNEVFFAGLSCVVEQYFGFFSRVKTWSDRALLCMLQSSKHTALPFCCGLQSREKKEQWVVFCRKTTTESTFVSVTVCCQVHLQICVNFFNRLYMYIYMCVCVCVCVYIYIYINRINRE